MIFAASSSFSFTEPLFVTASFKYEKEMEFLIFS